MVKKLCYDTIDRRGVMENERVNVYIHIRVKRVLTGCIDGGIIDRRGVMENEDTGMCYCIHTQKVLAYKL